MHDPSADWNVFYRGLWEEDPWVSWLNFRAIAITRRYIEDSTYDSQCYLELLKKMQTCAQTLDGHTFSKALLDECENFLALLEPLKEMFAECQSYTVDFRRVRVHHANCEVSW